MQTTSYSSLPHHTPRSHIIFLAPTSYSSLPHHTPRFDIILLASTSYSSLPPYNIHQARYDATSPTTTHPQPTSTVSRHPPAQTVPWFKSGESSRQNNRKKRKNVLRWLGAEETNGSDFAGCKKSPVTVTREGGVSAPDWRREDATPQKGAERESVSEGEWEKRRERRDDVRREWKETPRAQVVVCARAGEGNKEHQGRRLWSVCVR